MVLFRIKDLRNENSLKGIHNQVHENYLQIYFVSYFMFYMYILTTWPFSINKI